MVDDDFAKMPEDGIIAWQLHAGGPMEVTFRNIQFTNLSKESATPKDARFEKPKDYNGYFPWTPPASLKEWNARRRVVREQVLIATGLWPLPEKTPLHAVVHGKIERDGYTIEKAFFASYPGHYVTGNLYRPTGKTGRLPAVLCPHGHWANGRFYENSDKGAQKEIQSGAEKTSEGAKYPLQARCAQLARMGCVVFHYDMVGYADSKQLEHRKGFLDPEAELRLQSFMGLQTWNSVRALDFLSSLPDVDAQRIGVTGASGGGTQTFLLCAVDDRPAAAFPAVMVSTAMQGGCICENCSYLRVGTGNIELAGLFAPKPLGMSGANDWTKEIETKGLPELKALYKLYGAEDNVMAAHRPFPHNYNQVSRELMYNFFNKHLHLGQTEPIVEKPFVPVPPKELSVFDAEHPLPSDAVGADGLRRYLTKESEQQLAALLPKDAEGLQKFRAVLKPALRTLISDELPQDGSATEQLNLVNVGGDNGDMLVTSYLSRQGRGEAIPMAAVFPPPARFNGQVVVWVHQEDTTSTLRGGKVTPLARKIVEGGSALLVVEVFRTGASAKEPQATTNMKIGSNTYAGYFFGYNRSLVAERVHDILTAVTFARLAPGVKSVHLVGFGEAGPWVALARGLCGDKVARTAADLNGFRFEQVKSFDDPMMLPGALKYGGLTTLAALAAPHELYLHNTKGTGPASFLEAAYKAAGQPQNLVRHEERMDPAVVLQWLLR
jgi:dienelactone hydrolase